MSHITNDDAITRYVRDASNGGLRPHKGYSGGTIRLNGDEELIYWRRGGTHRVGWGPVKLVRWAPDSRTFVMNGDGFTDGFARMWQGNLRTAVQGSILSARNPLEVRPFRAVEVPRDTNYILIPYAAMTAAGIDPLSIRPIDVTEDEWEEVRHPVPTPPADSSYRIVTEGQTARTYEATKGGVRFRQTKLRRQTYVHNVTGEETPYPNHSQIRDYRQVFNWTWNGNSLMVWEAGQRTPATWARINGLDGGGWGWTERIHHLGAAVFSAIDGSGKRSKFVSGFDEDEPRQLYYLAQLPRKKVRTYREAIDSLAPPIVHEARRKNIHVRRQGDIFAIATPHTDESMYAMARTRVRREVALHDPTRQGVTPPNLDQHDVRERDKCPCCGTSAWIGWGPKARRALQIYGTTHTATEVVVVPGGATFVKGTMYHDPHLETAGRRPEHQTLDLSDGGSTWYLAVRNTVPRQKIADTNDYAREEVTA